MHRDRSYRRLRTVLLAAAALLVGVSVADDVAKPAAPVAVPISRQADSVAVLTVDGVIDQMTLVSLERRVAEAMGDGADAIVLEINTPGGRLDATLDICHLIRTGAPANTVAWINPQAYSAGTIIALACREIVVSPAASFGDAAPIQVGMFGGLNQLADAERAKAESPVLESVIASARRNHYDENLVQAFVSVGIELWMVEHVQTGQRIFVNRNEYEAVFGEPPPAELTPVAPPSGSSPDAVAPWFNTTIPEDHEGIDPERLAREIERAQTLPPSRAPLTKDDAGDWKLIMQVISSDRLLTVGPAEAKFYGLATATIADDAQLKRYFGATTITRYDRSWSEHMVAFLTNPIARGLLLVVFVLCMLIEMAIPGSTVFGLASGAALLVLIGAPFLAGMAQWWEIALIGAGLLLVAAEVFVIPGFGIAGVLGAASLLVGVVGTFVSGNVGSPQGQADLVTGLVTTVASLFAVGVGVWLLSRQLHSLPVLNRLILHSEVAERDRPPSMLESMRDTGADLPVGAVGVVTTGLRPAGRAEFDGRLHDVKSVGGFVDAGAAVRVVSADRFVIQVEQVEDHEDQT